MIKKFLNCFSIAEKENSINKKIKMIGSKKIETPSVVILRYFKTRNDWILIDELISLMIEKFNINSKYENSINVSIRQEIKKLRRKGFPIISKRGKGYKFCRSNSELKEFINTEKARANDILKTVKALEEHVSL